MLTIGADQRRARMMRRHRLAVGCRASSVVDAAASMVVLHATDPATVYLSVLARCPTATLADISAELYDHHSLIKMLGMRRTMFVVPSELVPVVHSAASLAVAARLRARLLKELSTLPTEPEVGADVDAWLTDVEDSTEKALLARGEALAGDLAADEPRLRTALLPTTDKSWDVKTLITSRVLTIMGAEGRIVRGRPGGGWFSRRHTWTAARSLWPDGLPAVPAAEARQTLVRRWLEVFGPATVADVQWWTGWSLGVTRAALSGLDTVDVDLDGMAGIVLADDVEDVAAAEPSAVLLPALDPTPMGWKHRDWFLGPHRAPLFDRNGNIGPTVWWDGRIVGGWAVRGSEVAWRVLEDIGSQANAAVEASAADLRRRLEGTGVIPTFRTPLERELTA